MLDPFATLGLEPGVAQETLRRRYLTLVRQFPPDREPRRFAEIRVAYDRLRDPVAYLKDRLFKVETDDSIGAVLTEVQTSLRDKRIPTDFLLSLGKS